MSAVINTPSNDILTGGMGNDTYVWGYASGTDVLRDEGGYDVVHINATTSQISLSAHTDDGSLVIWLNGESLTILDYFNTAGSGHIEELAFADGSRWGLKDVQFILAGNPPPPPPTGGKVLSGTDADEVLVGTDFGDTISGGAGTDLLEGGYGDDVYLWGQGHGIDVVRDYGGNDIIKINATPDQLKFYGDLEYKGYPLIIKFGDKDQLAIEGYFIDEAFKNGNIERLVFSDGTVWTKEDVLKVLIPVEPSPTRGNFVVGTAGDETLWGTDYNDTIDGHGGNDTLYGGDGDDLYRWGTNYGDTVIDDDSGIDTIRFNVASTSIHLFSDQDGGLIIRLNDKSLTIRDYFNVSGSGHIEKLTFSDGSVWGLAEVKAALAGGSVPPPGVFLEGTEGKDTLNGSDGADTISGGGSADFLRGYKGDDVLIGDAGDDLLVADEGNDTLIGGAGADHLDGGAGNDVYLWGPQSGSDFIWDYKGSDTVRIDALASEVQLFKAQVEGAPLHILLEGASLTINDYFNQSENGGYIDNIVFKDGTVWHMEDVLAALGQTNPPPPPSGQYLLGTAGSDTLKGGIGNDTLNGAAGDDALYGGKGDDVYLWGPNSGNDLIQDAGGNDVVRINAASSAVELFAHVDGTLVISLNGQNLTIRNYLAGGDEGGHIEHLEFSDGVSWNLSKVLEILASKEPPPPPAGLLLTGTDGNDTLQGGTGDDTVDGGLGNDVLFGGTGNDIYIWSQGKGYDLIEDAGGNDTVQLGVTSSDVDLLMHIDGTLVISAVGGSLTIRNYLAASDEGGHIEKLVFSDGVVWNVDKVLEIIASRQPEPNTDPDPAPEPEGEIIVGQKNNDVLIGTADDDTLMGGVGHDTLDGGAGNDILIGGQGKDVLTGGAGEDFFTFVKKSDLGLGNRKDVIVDFEVGNDLIDLGRIDANSTTKKNDAFKVLLKGQAAFTKAGQLHYDAKTGILSGNTDKDAEAEFQIQLKNKPKALHLDDFVL